MANNLAMVYGRVSTKRQTKGNSINDQHEMCVQYCKNNGLKVSKKVSEYSSAFRTTPRKLRRMISASNAGKHIVIAYAHRFSRNSVFGGTLLEEASKYNITIHFVAENLTSEREGQKHAMRQAILNAQGSATEQSIIQKNRCKVSKKRGNELGSAPYGKRVQFVDGIRKKVPHKLEQGIIHMIKCLFEGSKLHQVNKILNSILPHNKNPIMIEESDGSYSTNQFAVLEKQTTRQIANLLNSYGIKYRSNSNWTSTIVRRIINNNMRN